MSASVMAWNSQPLGFQLPHYQSGVLCLVPCPFNLTTFILEILSKPLSFSQNRIVYFQPVLPGISASGERSSFTSLKTGI